jgi:hypothetical protein
LYAAAGSPVPLTIIKAMEAGNFTTWPTLTEQQVKKYLKISEATVKGHLNQTRKNVRSTGPKTHHVSEEAAKEFEPHITKCMNVVYAAIHAIEGHTYTDLTGRFPTTSSRGYKYILVLYDYDSNNIQAEPMKNRSDTEAIRADKRIYKELTAKGLKPPFQTMENEASKALKLFLPSNDIQFQLVPPHAAERAMQTFKNHFVAMPCSTDKIIPIHLWDRLIPQTVLTLNLLRQSHINPKFLAHAQLNRPFDYN